MGASDPAGDLPAPIPDTFLRSVERLVNERVDPLRVDVDKRVDRELLTSLGELGVFGVSIPEADGGFGFGLAGACATVDRIARRDRSVATTVGLHLGLGTRGMVAFGSDAQRERWLPSLASGETISAFATTEPQSGSDLSRLATNARAVEGGIRVNGQKIYVTNGGLAGLITITASTPNLGGAARGQSLVALLPDDPGLEVGAEEHKLGLRGSSTTSLFLQDVDVPADRIVGEEPGHGQRQLTHVLAWGRTIMASGCLGTARGATDLAVRHVAERVQFGKPLITLPVVRRQLAEMGARLFAMEALIAETAALEPDADALELLSLSTKVFCSEADWEVCDRALQLHGGSGYIEESGVPLHLRDARITRIFEGANDVLLGRIGAAEVVRPRPAATAAVETELDALVAEARSAALDGRGLKVLRDGPVLHRIGRLVVLRDATRAAVGAAGSDESRNAMASLWTRVARAAAQSVVTEAALAADDTLIESALSEVLR